MNEELAALINQVKAVKAKNIEKDKTVDSSTCEVCKSQKVFYDDVQNLVICMDCGADQKILVLNDDHKYYDEQISGVNRCSAPISSYFPKTSMGTSIVGGRGNNFLIKKLHSQHNKIPYREKKRSDTLGFVRSQCHDKLPQCVIDLSIKIIVEYVESSGRRGKNRMGMIMAATWQACKERGVPRTVQEIAAIYNKDKTVLTKGNKLLMTIMREKDYQFNCELFKPGDYLARYCSKLGINRYKKIIIKVFKLIKHSKLVEDNNDNSIMAASILICAHRYALKIARSDVSDHCKVSQVTIYKCYKKLKLHKDIIKAELMKYEKK
jgi:transcription initiation factor TFIIIB Brf1 subunit/transcription initiation factor TFIIB